MPLAMRRPTGNTALALGFAEDCFLGAWLLFNDRT
jgi:hypothetical protein